MKVCASAALGGGLGLLIGAFVMDAVARGVQAALVAQSMQGGW
jgi:hypothetical protein